MVFVSQTEPRTIYDILSDENWIATMHEELNKFTRNNVWTLIPRTKDMNVIGTKWVYRNKMD